MLQANGKPDDNLKNQLRPARRMAEVVTIRHWNWRANLQLTLQHKLIYTSLRAVLPEPPKTSQLPSTGESARVRFIFQVESP